MQASLPAKTMKCPYCGKDVASNVESCPHCYMRIAQFTSSGPSPRTMPEITYLKITCERCGKHIEYPSEMAGQSIQCPACQHTIKLLSPPPQPQPPPTMERTSGSRVRLYWIKKQGDSEATGPFTFPQVQGMWHAGTVKVTDTIRRDGKIEWHFVSEVQRQLDSGGGQLTTGKIVLAIVLAFLILGFLWTCSALVLH
jgi:DNA-directed RNA polymerase subunit RPC12/RpoP